MKNGFRLDNSRIPCLGPVHPSASFLKFRRRHSLDYIGFDLVADLDVVEVLKTDTAFEAFAYFGCVILESAQRSDVAFPGDDAIANQTRARLAADNAVDDHGAGHRTNLGHFEDFAYFRLAENLFLLYLLEHSNHRGFNFFLDLINDRMQANVDAFLFSQITRPRFRANVEADDHDGG